MVCAQKEQLVVLFIVSYNIVVKDDWLERTIARNRSVYQTPQTFNHPYNLFFACCNLFLYGLNQFFQHLTL